MENAHHLRSDEPAVPRSPILEDMTTTGRNRTAHVRARRPIAMVGLLAAALFALLIAGVNRLGGSQQLGGQGAQPDQRARLVVAEVLVDSSYRPYWEEQGTPVIGRVVEPAHLAHYELVTKPGFDRRPGTA